jgi:methionyl-tRNA formyltransferase
VYSGPIIAHVRPEIAAGDGPHDVGNKAIVAAANALGDAALALEQGPLTAVPQSGGRVYRRADFSADAVRRLYQNFDNGMIDRYLANRAARDAPLALVTMAPRDASVHRPPKERREGVPADGGPMGAPAR